MIGLNAWREVVYIQELPNSMETYKIDFWYRQIYLVSYISVAIQLMSTGDTFTTDIDEWLYIDNVKVEFQNRRTIYYISQVFKHNN